jgi:hypothetical protein
VSSSAIRAGAAYIELSLRDGVSRPLHAASVALRDFGNRVAWQGARIAAMGAAVSAPLAAMAHSFARSALESGRFANRRDASNVQAYVSALLRLSNAMTAFRDAVGSAVLPLMSRWPNALARIVNQATAWVRANRALVQGIARFASMVVMAGTGLIVIGKALAMAGSVFGALATVASVAATAMAALGSVLAFIFTPLGLVVAGVVALGTYLLWATGAGEAALGWLGEAFAGLQADASQAWQGIIDSLLAGDLEGAVQVVWSVIKLEWQKGVNAINQIWISAKEFFLNVWSNASFDAAGYMIDAWAMIESAWVETVSFLKQGWLTFTGFLTKNLNWAVGELQKLWVKFRKWLGEDIDVNAEVKKIDETTKGAEQIIAADTKAQKNKTEGRREQQRNEIEQRRLGAQANLGQDQNAEGDARAQEFERQRKASELGVTQARNEFNKATDDAKKKREQMPPPEPPPGLLAPMATEKAKLESKGSFNAMAVRGLGSSSLADRTAKATEKSADLLKDIKENTKNAGLVFQ